MDPTARFFTKLRKLAVTLETETDKLQLAYQNRNDDDDSENAERAMRAYHELNAELRDLRGQVQDQLAQQRAKEDEMGCFIKACMVMEQRFTEDIQRLSGHCQKYGYQAPQDTHRPNKVKGQGSEATDGAEEEDEARPAGGEEGQRGEAGADPPPASPPQAGPPPANPLRTPQLSDFGLSEALLKRALGGAGLCPEAPPMPQMSLPHPSLYMPVTPKCTLRMEEEEEDELQTPQLHHFGITEHTMCLNNDFTMDLHRKNVEKTQRPPHVLPVPPVNSVMDGLQTNAAGMESPEPPVFCTPGFKITKSTGRSSAPALGRGDPESPGRPGNQPSTPEVPAFQTLYMNRLLSTRKGARELEPGDTRAGDENPAFHLPSPCGGAAGSHRSWEYDVPETSIGGGGEDKRTPQMPSLESILGSSLLNRSAAVTKQPGEAEERRVPRLELDGPTQEFSLGTPRVRGGYREPSTPEMPDLSSVTQDICKLVSQTQLKKPMAVVSPDPRPAGKENRAVSVSAVSESEFQSLPSYLRQMTLSSLNQAVHKINSAAAGQGHGEQAEFAMEELRRITGVGTKAPIYFLCLTELERLEHVHGVGVSSVYKLTSHS
ncbi:SKA complex subunit 3 [Centroberyx affinis]|uniref:SKA complex subunit 3 n=1 Tax=Centroberyx affinis TaxID=166261 RepID=UPI003A5BD9B5